MAHHLLAKPLTFASVDRAFPVARAAAAGLELAQWRRFAAEQIRRGPAEGGIITVENSARTILGLASYRIEPVLAFEAVCSAENFVAFDLLNNAAVARVLARALENLARRQGATAIRIVLPHCAAKIERPARPLFQSGYGEDSIRFFKRLT